MTTLATEPVYNHTLANVIVRAENQTDFPFLEKIEAYREDGGAWSTEELREYRNLPGVILKVAEYERRPIAHVMYQRRDDEVGILTFVVHPLSRSRGVGSLLLNLVKEKVRRFHLCQRAVAFVRERNLPMQTFLRLQGFKAVALKRSFYIDSGEDGYEMEWRP